MVASILDMAVRAVGNTDTGRQILGMYTAGQNLMNGSYYSSLFGKNQKYTASDNYSIDLAQKGMDVDNYLASRGVTVVKRATHEEMADEYERLSGKKVKGHFDALHYGNNVIVREGLSGTIDGITAKFHELAHIVYDIADDDYKGADLEVHRRGMELLRMYDNNLWKLAVNSERQNARSGDNMIAKPLIDSGYGGEVPVMEADSYKYAMTG